MDSNQFRFQGDGSADINFCLVHTPHVECNCQDDFWHIVGSERMALPKPQQGGEVLIV